MTFARKVDANTKALTEAFRRLGCLVHVTNGSWDLTVCKFGIVALIECKDPKSPNLKRRNKGDDLIDQGFPIQRVLTLDDVIAVCDKLRQVALMRDGYK
jgi:hypothetical protein